MLFRWQNVIAASNLRKKNMKKIHICVQVPEDFDDLDREQQSYHILQDGDWTKIENSNQDRLLELEEILNSLRALSNSSRAQLSLSIGELSKQEWLTANAIFNLIKNELEPSEDQTSSLAPSPSD